MMTGKATTVHVASPNANRRMTSSTVANVRPIGQTRQNTGKPKTSEEPNAAARMPWRLSILMPLALPQGEAHAEQGEATLPPLPSLSPSYIVLATSRAVAALFSCRRECEIRDAYGAEGACRTPQEPGSSKKAGASGPQVDAN